jgi:hypothetical protein
MQTFLPYRSFKMSMRVLDPSRLGNQVYREGMTLLRGGWPNHPASKMWRGYEPALALYLWAGVVELERRGRVYDDRPWYHELRSHITHSCELPPWLGDEAIHSSHRSALLYKDPEWYGRFGWTEEPVGPHPITGKLQYIWPEAA